MRDFNKEFSNQLANIQNELSLANTNDRTIQHLQLIQNNIKGGRRSRGSMNGGSMNGGLMSGGFVDITPYVSMVVGLVQTMGRFLPSETAIKTMLDSKFLTTVLNYLPKGLDGEMTATITSIIRNCADNYGAIMAGALLVTGSAVIIHKIVQNVKNERQNRLMEKEQDLFRQKAIQAQLVLNQKEMVERAQQNTARIQKEADEAALEKLKYERKQAEIAKEKEKERIKREAEQREVDYYRKKLADDAALQQMEFQAEEARLALEREIELIKEDERQAQLNAASQALENEAQAAKLKEDNAIQLQLQEQEELSRLANIDPVTIPEKSIKSNTKNENKLNRLNIQLVKYNNTLMGMSETSSQRASLLQNIMLVERQINDLGGMINKPGPFTSVLPVERKISQLDEMINQPGPFTTVLPVEKKNVTRKNAKIPDENKLIRLNDQLLKQQNTLKNMDVDSINRSSVLQLIMIIEKQISVLTGVKKPAAPKKPATIKKPAAPKKPVTPKKPAAPKKAVAKVTKKQKNKYVA